MRDVTLEYKGLIKINKQGYAVSRADCGVENVAAFRPNPPRELSVCLLADELGVLPLYPPRRDGFYQEERDTPVSELWWLMSSVSDTLTSINQTN